MVVEVDVREHEKDQQREYGKGPVDQVHERLCPRTAALRHYLHCLKYVKIQQEHKADHHQPKGGIAHRNPISCKYAKICVCPEHFFPCFALRSVFLRLL